MYRTVIALSSAFKNKSGTDSFQEQKLNRQNEQIVQLAVRKKITGYIFFTYIVFENNLQR